MYAQPVAAGFDVERVPSEMSSPRARMRSKQLPCMHSRAGSWSGTVADAPNMPDRNAPADPEAPSASVAHHELAVCANIKYPWTANATGFLATRIRRQFLRFGR